MTHYLENSKLASPFESLFYGNWWRGGDSNLRFLKASLRTAPLRFKKACDSRGSDKSAIKKKLDLPEKATLRLKWLVFSSPFDSLLRRFWWRRRDSNLRFLKASLRTAPLRFKKAYDSRGFVSLQFSTARLK